MPNPNDCKETGLAWIKTHGSVLMELSQKIWEFAELGLEEYRSAQLLVDFLEAQGFSVRGTLPEFRRPLWPPGAWENRSSGSIVSTMHSPGFPRRLSPKNNPLSPELPVMGAAITFWAWAGRRQRLP
jgi:aminobenzoyl-glutamate utilization protein B